MNCHKAEKKISDLLDGRLSERNKGSIEEHLNRCPVCLNYKKHLEVLRSEVKKMERPQITLKDTQDFSFRLKRKLQTESRKSRTWVRRPLNRGWAWGSIGLLVVVFVILYFAVKIPPSAPIEEYFMLSFEDTLSEIYGEIDSDKNLEDLFNSLILVSIDKAMEDLDWDTDDFILMNPLYRDDITEDELKRIEEGIKKDTDS
jgi:hypothetical protein